MEISAPKMLFSARLRQRYTAHILLMAPPIGCDLGYRFRTRTLNPNPKTDPDPNRKSNNNLCSAKRHPNKLQDSVINMLFRRAGGGGVTGLSEHQVFKPYTKGTLHERNIDMLWAAQTLG